MTRCSPLIPAEITAGLDFRACVYLLNYSVNEWGLQLVARGPQAINLTATVEGDGFVLAAPAATTATWAPGKYWFSLRATQVSRTVEIEFRELTVLQDLASVTGVYDGRTQNEISLDALDAVIDKRATVDQMRYKINERELWRMPIAELLKLRSYLSTKVRRERERRNGCSTFGRPVNVRFNSQ